MSGIALRWLGEVFAAVCVVAFAQPNPKHRKTTRIRRGIRAKGRGKGIIKHSESHRIHRPKPTDRARFAVGPTQSNRRNTRNEVPHHQPQAVI